MNRGRRAFVAALVGGGVGASTLQPVRGFLDRLAPLTGSVWDAARRTVPGDVDTPYGAATVRYDDQGVPTVEADDDASLYFAVGYVQAADRLFQLDLIRRRMRGTLAAALGEQPLESDVFHAQMDFASAADASWDVVEGTDAGDAIEAYAAGVNAYLDREDLPLEFRLVGYEPDPWTPVDSMLVEKQIGWGLTGSFETLRRAAAADAWGEDLAAALYPNRLDHDSPILRPSASFGHSETAPNHDGPSSPSPAMTNWLSGFEPDDGVGSNSWVVSGEHTESGTPLLANDPHLDLLAPPIWYEMHHKTEDLDVSGVAFPGIPFVVIGENSSGAWGFTNAKADCIDFYRYETDGERYRHGDEWREFDAEERTIEVSGGENREITVRKSVHGPVIERAGEQVGVAWTGLVGARTAEAVYDLDRSDGVDSARSALQKFDQPTQNAVYADQEGNTLYTVTGLVPIRETDGEAVRGDRIFDGSAREGEWPGYEPYSGPDVETGWIPFEEKPMAQNPDYLATANQRSVDDSQLDYYFAESYSAPWRGARIYDMLDERAESDRPIDAEFSRRVQRDVYDERAALFVPTVLDASSEMSPRAREMARNLDGWDFEMDRDSRGALVFERFVEQYRSAVFDGAFEEAGFDDAYYPNDWVLLHLGPESRWFTDRPAGSSRQRVDVIAAAMDSTAAEIEAEEWETYGDYNVTAIDHPFDLGPLNYDRLPTDGSPATVRNFRRESSVGSSYRLLARFDGEPSSTVIPGGNDGDYFSDHYGDQLEAWADGRYSNLEPTTTSEDDPAIRFHADDSGGAGDE